MLLRKREAGVRLSLCRDVGSSALAESDGVQRSDGVRRPEGRGAVWPQDTLLML